MIPNTDECAASYIALWNENYSLVKDRAITRWMVSQTMSDIEFWIDGEDPNGSKSSANAGALSRDALRQLYSILSSTATLYGYSPSERHLVRE